MSAFVSGLFEDAPHAQQAVTALVEGSFPLGESSVRTRDERGGVEPVPIRHKTAAPVGAVIGAIVGAGAAALAVSGDGEGSSDPSTAPGVPSRTVPARPRIFSPDPFASRLARRADADRDPRFSSRVGRPRRAEHLARPHPRHRAAGRASYSVAVARTLAEAQEPPVAMTVHDLSAIPLYNQDLDGDDPPVPVRAFKDAIARADGLVIVTPEYNYGLPGVLKNALDWASRPAFESVLQHKPVLPISNSPAFTGGARALTQLKTVLLATLSHVVPGPEVVLGGIHRKITDGRLADADHLAFAQKQIDELVARIEARS